MLCILSEFCISLKLRNPFSWDMTVHMWVIISQGFEATHPNLPGWKYRLGCIYPRRWGHYFASQVQDLINHWLTVISQRNGILSYIAVKSQNLWSMELLFCPNVVCKSFMLVSAVLQWWCKCCHLVIVTYHCLYVTPLFQWHYHICHSYLHRQWQPY